MKQSLKTFSLLAGLAVPFSAFALEPSEKLSDPALEARARNISGELRCLVCQNQSIDDSDAPLAKDLRTLVREQIKVGATDEQVRNFVVSRYGDFVLLRPPFKPETLLLWLAPLLVLIGGGSAIWSAARKRRWAVATPKALSEAERLRLKELGVENADASGGAPTSAQHSSNHQASPDMSNSHDFYPGFASHWIDTQAGKIFARSHGAGAPVLLLHGFGETNIAWRKIASRLAERFFVVVMDLRGYGWSSVPDSENGKSYAKRLMAEDAVTVMEELGHVQFALVGHDRGARVGMRLALDHPGRLTRLALLDIAPLEEGVGDSNLQRVGRAKFMSFEAPRPENLIAMDPGGFLIDALQNGTRDKTLDPFGDTALEAYCAAFADPLRIHAFCEDFRAGEGVDKEQLLADKAAGKKIIVPTQLLWSAAHFPQQPSLLESWREWASDLRGEAIDSGHYLAEEAPEAVLKALEGFL
ncbi:alpha/beta fold hydrolase [Methylocystis heyeri]|uniref:Cytochrome c-type biogenesis protein n=1 Tax=Methylocystis heyeri TaxID=391905 RepID=A0A6B8KFD2_9HYPH|nr:alpha/beta fold hydrolase [Methylocystis heyeri]